jgi:outer membrane protein assembly factor BamB/tetratricopeptide (TPR) repeat protein
MKRTDGMQPGKRVERDNRDGRDAIPRVALRSVFFAVFPVLATALGLHAATARDARYAEERRALESARYLHAIEGDTAAARARLDRLEGSANPEIRTQSLYLRAGFLEESGDANGAVRLYREALEHEGLEPAQKQRLVARLLALKPDAVRPFREAGRTRGLPAHVFETSGPSGSEYVLAGDAGEIERAAQASQAEQAAAARQTARLQWQDADGLLHPLKAALEPDEDVLDAAPDRVLTRSAARQRVFLRRAPRFAAEPVAERFTADEGTLFSGASGEYLLLGAQQLRHMRGAQTLFTHPLPGPGCSWHPSGPRARQGVLFCPGQGVYRADFGRRSISPLPLGGEIPSEIVLSGEYLALRYMDHIEVRRGPAFETFLWGFPAGLQDPMVLGRGHAFIASTDGPLRAFVLRTGQLDWQREDGASALRVHDGELFVLTHARVLVAVDERGRQLYTYEPGWDGEEPLLLPGRDWIVVQNADGTRVRLNRELLRLTGGSRDHLLRGARESQKRGDSKGALRQFDAALALEPGNGTAWREKARLLAATGAARALQTRAWTQAARSQSAPVWSADPAFAGLAAGIGASWVWKRQPGPRFFPVLTGGRFYSFYVENDNQTLVVLDTRSGAFKASFRFPEALDMKVSAWTGDTLIVSSPSRLYLVAPARNAGILAQVALRGAVCNAVMLPRGLLVSDWSGNLQLLDLATREPVWETRLGRGGVLMAQGSVPDQIDAFEIEGTWHRLRLTDGKAVETVRLPPGTITEVHAGRDFAYAGYNEGLIVAIDRNLGTIAWQRDMGEQIFSMSGRGDQVLLVGTASKRVLNLNGRNGLVQAQAHIPTYLFNRPLLSGDSYWVGTTEPALERRSLTHVLLQKFPLTDMPGTPSQAGNGVAVSTLDNFILVFPAR